MSERDGYIPGVPCWIDTAQPDPEAAAAFYGGLFGWEFENVMPRGLARRSTTSPACAAATWPPSARRPRRAADRRPGTRTSGWTRRRDRRQGAAAGGRVRHRAVRRRRTRAGWRCSPTPRAPRSASGSPAGTAGAQVVNEHGAAELQQPPHARPRAARRRSTARSSAGRRWTRRRRRMWALPGYGDFLEERRPGPARADGGGRRARPASRTSSRHQPHPRRAADTPGALERHVRRRRRRRDRRRAAELGGEVLVAPFDAPWVRMTVITDPQGATFTASKFVPENRDLAAPTGAGAA